MPSVRIHDVKERSPDSIDRGPQRRVRERPLKSHTVAPILAAMGEYRDAVRRGQLAYLWKVVLWLAGGGLLALFGIAFAVRLFGESPVAMGVVGFSAILGVVAGALAIHRANVRCPACSEWLVPVGMNGFAPSRCPKCSANLA